MPARLTAYLPDNAAAVCLLRTQERVRVGRGSDCDFRLVHPSISRRHAELSLEQDQWRLDDSGEYPGLAHCENREDAAQHIRRGEDRAELFVARAGVVGEADRGGCDRQHNGSPPGDSRDAGQRRAAIEGGFGPMMLC